MFSETKFKLLALTTTTLKVNGEVSWNGVSGIIVGVQETERARKSVAIFTNDECHSAVNDFGYVSSRTLWVKFKFSMVKACVVVEYSPTAGDVEEKERFWNNLRQGYR